MKTTTQHSKFSSSPSHLKIKSGVKGGLRIGGMSDTNHNQKQVKLAIKSGVKGGLRIGGMGDTNHNQKQVRPR